MKNLLLATILWAILLVPSLSFSNQISIFDFQVDAGEGNVNIFRVKMDIGAGIGMLYYVDTYMADVPYDHILKLREGHLWSSFLKLDDMNSLRAEIELFEPPGWFYVHNKAYLGDEYSFVFIGIFSNERLSGTIYQFVKDFDHSGDLKGKYIDFYEIDVKAAKSKGSIKKYGRPRTVDL